MLTVQGDQISAQLEGVPLRDVLAELAQQTQIEFLIPKGDAQRPITAKFSDLPLQEGIKRLLEGSNYVLLTEAPSSQTGKQPRIKQIRVLSAGAEYTKIKGRADTAKAPGGDAATPSGNAEAGSGLDSDDPQERIAALEALVKAHGDVVDDTIMPTLLESFQEDPSGDVRYAALQFIYSTEGKMPVEQLSHAATQDTDPRIRSEALRGLAVTMTDDSLATVRQGLQDPDPQVRNEAQRALAGVEAYNKAVEEAKANPLPINMEELRKTLEGKSEEERLEYVLENVMKNASPAYKDMIRKHYRENIKNQGQ
jgi:hypothetical protein